MYVRTISSNGRSNYLRGRYNHAPAHQSMKPATDHQKDETGNERVEHLVGRERPLSKCSKDKGDSLLDSTNVKEAQPGNYNG